MSIPLTPNLLPEPQGKWEVATKNYPVAHTLDPRRNEVKQRVENQRG